MGRFSIFKHKSLVESYLRIEAEQADLQKRLDKATSDLEHIKREKASTFNENVELTQRIRVIEEAFHKFSPLLDLNYLKTSNQEEMQRNTWAAWSNVIADTAAVEARKQRACEYVLTPLSINAGRGCATFMGQSAAQYHTSLKDCECQDFIRRLCPCKHMYRLAHELGIEQLEKDVFYVDEPAKLIPVSTFKNIIKPTLSNAEIDILCQLLNSYSYVGAPSSFKNLFKYNLVQVCPEKYFLLNAINRDELLALLPKDDKFKRSSKKEELIQHIIDEYPDLITEIEKLNIAVCISPYAKHLVEYFPVIKPKSKNYPFKN